jgi:hypothetical protein
MSFRYTAENQTLRSWPKKSDDELIDVSVPIDARELTDEEIEDHDLGVEAGLAGNRTTTPSV